MPEASDMQRPWARGGYLFVYGTLKRGGTGHACLRNARYVRSALTRPAYTMVSLGAWPGLLQRGHAKVAGELYYCAAALWPLLDAYEECPEIYERVPVALCGSMPVAQAYVLRARHRYPTVVTGRWNNAATTAQSTTWMASEASAQ